MRGDAILPIEGFFQRSRSLSVIASEDRFDLFNAKGTVAHPVSYAFIFLVLIRQTPASTSADSSAAIGSHKGTAGLNSINVSRNSLEDEEAVVHVSIAKCDVK